MSLAWMILKDISTSPWPRPYVRQFLKISITQSPSGPVHSRTLVHKLRAYGPNDTYTSKLNCLLIKHRWTFLFYHAECPQTLLVSERSSSDTSCPCGIRYFPLALRLVYLGLGPEG